MGEEEKKEKDESKDEEEHEYKIVDASKGRPPLGFDQLREKWFREQLPNIVKGIDVIKKHPDLFEKDWTEEILGFTKRAKALQAKGDKFSKNDIEEGRDIQDKMMPMLGKILEKVDRVDTTTTKIQSGKMGWRYWVLFFIGMIGSGLIGWAIGKFFP